MPPREAYTLSDYGGEPVCVLCEDCEVLKSISSAELMIEFGDLQMPTMLEKILSRSSSAQSPWKASLDDAGSDTALNPAASNLYRMEHPSTIDRRHLGIDNRLSAHTK